MKRLLLSACAALGLSACAMDPSAMDDWTYISGKDDITGRGWSQAFVTLDNHRYSDAPSSLSVMCDHGRLQAYVSTRGYWGDWAGRKGFKLRIDDKVYSGQYLHDVDGDAAWLISYSPPANKVGNKQEFFQRLLSANYIAVSVQKWDGGWHSAKRENMTSGHDLQRVLSECGATR